METTREKIVRELLRDLVGTVQGGYDATDICEEIMKHVKETEKRWVLKAYPEDTYYGDPLVEDVVFTESEKNALDERYMKWITENDDIYEDEEGYPINDKFMYYLGKVEGMDTRECWEWAYWAEVKGGN